MQDPVKRGIRGTPSEDELRDWEQQKQIEALSSTVSRPKYPESIIVQTEEQKEAEIERRAQERISTALNGLPNFISSEVNRAVENRATETAQALETVARKLVADQAFMDSIAQHLQNHRVRTFYEWLGQKVWLFAVTAIVGALLAWNVFIAPLLKTK